jgi:hypothetical protein
MYIGGTGDAVETQAILSVINLVQQVFLQLLELHLIDLALEHRLLYSLSHRLAGPGDPSQPPSTFACFSGDVVADDY